MSEDDINSFLKLPHHYKQLREKHDIIARIKERKVCENDKIEIAAYQQQDMIEFVTHMIQNDRIVDVSTILQKWAISDYDTAGEFYTEEMPTIVGRKGESVPLKRPMFFTQTGYDKLRDAIKSEPDNPFVQNIKDDGMITDGVKASYIPPSDRYKGKIIGLVDGGEGMKRELTICGVPHACIVDFYEGGEFDIIYSRKKFKYGDTPIAYSAREVMNIAPISLEGTVTYPEPWQVRWESSTRFMPYTHVALLRGIAIMTEDFEGKARTEVDFYLSLALGALTSGFIHNSNARYSDCTTQDMCKQWLSGNVKVKPSWMRNWDSAIGKQRKRAKSMVGFNDIESATEIHLDDEDIFVGCTKKLEDKMRKLAARGVIGDINSKMPYIESEQHPLLTVNAACSNTFSRVFIIISGLFYGLSYSDIPEGSDLVRAFVVRLAQTPNKISKWIDKEMIDVVRLICTQKRKYEIPDEFSDTGECDGKSLLYFSDTMGLTLLCAKLDCPDSYEAAKKCILSSSTFPTEIGKLIDLCAVEDVTMRNNVVIRLLTLLQRPSVLSGILNTTASTLGTTGTLSTKGRWYKDGVDGTEEAYACEFDELANHVLDRADIESAFDPADIAKGMVELMKMTSAGGDKISFKVSKAGIVEGHESEEDLQTLTINKKSLMIPLCADDIIKKSNVVIDDHEFYNLDAPGSIGMRRVPGRAVRLIFNVILSHHFIMLPFYKAIKEVQMHPPSNPPNYSGNPYALTQAKGNLLKDSFERISYAIKSVRENGSEFEDKTKDPSYVVMCDDASALDQHEAENVFGRLVKLCRERQSGREDLFSVLYGKCYFELLGDLFDRIRHSVFLLEVHQSGGSVFTTDFLWSGMLPTANLNTLVTSAVQLFQASCTRSDPVCLKIWGDDVFAVLECARENVVKLLHDRIDAAKLCGQLYTDNSHHGAFPHFLQQFSVGGQEVYRPMALDSEKPGSLSPGDLGSRIDDFAKLGARLGSTRATKVFIPLYGSLGASDRIFGKQYVYSFNCMFSAGGLVNRMLLGIPTSNPTVFLQVFNPWIGLPRVTVKDPADVKDKHVGERVMPNERDLVVKVNNRPYRSNCGEALERSAPYLIDKNRVISGNEYVLPDDLRYSNWMVNAVYNNCGSAVKNGKLSKFFMEKIVEGREIVFSDEKPLIMPLDVGKKIRISVEPSGYFMRISYSDVKIYHGEEVLREFPTRWHPFSMYPPGIRLFLSAFGVRAIDTTPRMKMLDVFTPNHRKDLQGKDVVNIIKQYGPHLINVIALELGFTTEEAHIMAMNWSTVDVAMDIDAELGRVHVPTIIDNISMERVETILDQVSPGWNTVLIDGNFEHELVGIIKKLYISWLYELANFNVDVSYDDDLVFSLPRIVIDLVQSPTD